MKQIVFIMFAIILSTSCKKEKDISEIINQDIEYTLDKYQKIVKQVPEDTALLPRNFENGEIGLVQPRDWTSGFYPGILWYLYEYTNDDFWKKQAQKETAKLKSQKDNTYTHDLGFMLICSYGNGYKFTKDTSYANILMQGAKSLISRYDSTVGLIRSWDHGKWEYPVIIDNMMNLEY